VVALAGSSRSGRAVGATALWRAQLDPYSYSTGDSLLLIDEQIARGPRGDVLKRAIDRVHGIRDATGIAVRQQYPGDGVTADDKVVDLGVNRNSLQSA
jgi:hypothetical protein